MSQKDANRTNAKKNDYQLHQTSQNHTTIEEKEDPPAMGGADPGCSYRGEEYCIHMNKQ
jgi:hypothetical protein